MSQSMHVAVVGSGISGLAAAWLLSRRFRVTLFEAGDYLGGHTNTVDIEVDGISAPVDTGFLVFNERTYPNLIELFGVLGVQSASSEMSFSVRVDEECLEWAGNSLASVFAQKRNLIRPEFWRMLKDILRFNRESGDIVVAQQAAEISLGDFLDRGGYGRSFRDWYLLPMSGAIWSCPTRQMLEYPAQTFFRFCHNHGLLQLTDRPRWRTVLGGGREYVSRMAAAIDDIRLACPVESVTRDDHGVQLRFAGEGQNDSHRSCSRATAIRRWHCWLTPWTWRNRCCVDSAISPTALFCILIRRCCRVIARRGRPGITSPARARPIPARSA